MMAAMVASSASSTTSSSPTRPKNQKTMSWPRDGEYSTYQSFAQRVQEQQEQQKQQVRYSVDQHRPPPSRSGPSPEKGQSRFQEGSMNDRVSAAPPAVFLSGEEEIEQYEKQFYAQPMQQQRPQQQQQQQQQQHQHQKEEKKGGGVGGFLGLAPLWDGVREKLNLRSTRSSGSITSITSMMMGGRAATEKETPPQLPPQLPAAEPAAPAKPAPSSTTGYPTREEVLESYKNLQASGFFSSHAIIGTRHPLRTAASAPMSTGTGGMNPPPAPSSFGTSFADRLAEHQRPGMLRSPISFSAIAEVESPDHRPRAHTNPFPHASGATPLPPPPPFANSTSDSTTSSPGRGMKRPSNEISAEQETATRKLVKKLRRTNSRASTTTNATAITIATTAATDFFKPARPSFSSIRIVEPSLFNGASPPPSPNRQSLRSKLSFAKLTKPRHSKEKDSSGASIKSRRGLNILGLGRRSKHSSEPESPHPTSPTSPAYSTFGGGPVQDIDAMMIDSFPSPPPQQQTSAAAAGPSELVHGPHHGYSRSLGATVLKPPISKYNHRHSSSTTSSRSSTTGFSLPVPTQIDYHYPQRVRPASRPTSQNGHHEPLSVVPDLNKGVPAIPAAPQHHQHPNRSSGSGAIPVYGKPVVVDIDEERRVKRESLRMMMMGDKSNRDSGLGSSVSVRSVSGQVTVGGGGVGQGYQGQQGPQGMQGQDDMDIW
ncbi:hypothetical protein QBC42DRAFT_272673 [Cladorrhinum samala]|uniref:Uncharacterized protein n=1 Tax=Cladorrhinum samala TaxID=585594 RepID=A0AAV9HJJ6_9PEZI|nr:hypothetical protein QBC42DRAFT_272673 [Cladorrhinum samala]